MNCSLIRVVFLLLSVFAVNSSYAQMGPPTPAPELKKLDFLAGDWTSEGTMTPSPGAPSGKWTMTSHAEWMDGSFFLVEHDEGDFAQMGKAKELPVMGYDAEEKGYTNRA